MSQIDDIRALYASRAVAAGVAAYDDDGNVILPDGATVKVSPAEAAIANEQRAAVPSRVDLASGKPEHTITLRRVSDGSLVEVHPLIRTGFVARESAWYARRLSELEPLMEQATDKAEFDRLNQQYSELMHGRFKLVVPDLPDGLLDDLSPGTDQHFWNTLTKIANDELGADDPKPEGVQGSP